MSARDPRDPMVEEEILADVESAILAMENVADSLENALYWAWMSAKGHKPPETDPIAAKAARMAGNDHQ